MWGLAAAQIKCTHLVQDGHNGKYPLRKNVFTMCSWQCGVEAANVYTLR